MSRRQERVKIVRKGSFAGKFLAFFLGAVVGVVGVFGGGALLGYTVYNQPIGSTVEKLDPYIDADLMNMVFGTTDEEGNTIPGVLNEKYSDLKILDLVKDLLSLYDGVKDKSLTLNDVNEISPILKQIVESLLGREKLLATLFDVDSLMTVPISGIKDYVVSQLSDAYIGDLLDAMGKLDSRMLIALSYGEEGVDYDIVDGEVVMRPGCEKTQISDLLSDTGMDEIIGNLTIDSVMKIDPSDTTMCSIAYGSKYRYRVVDGKVVMNQVTYEKIGDELFDIQGNAVDGTYDSIANTVTLRDGEVQYLVFDENGAFAKAYQDVEFFYPRLYSKTKIHDLSTDSSSVINNLYLKDALGIYDTSQHKVLISLAYGELNEDYIIDGTQIVVLDGKEPRTIGDLRKRGGNLINDIPLCDIMEEDQDDTLVMFMLYGRKGMHYEIVDGEVRMLQKRIGLDGDKVYDGYGERLYGHKLLNTQNRFYTDAKGNSYIYGTEVIGQIETADGLVNQYYLYELNGDPAKYPRASLGDMAGSENLITELTKRITLGELMDDDTLSHNVILKHLQNETMDTLPDAVENLTLQQIYGQEIFVTDASGNFVDEHGQILTEAEYDRRVVKGEWKYMLTDPDTGVVSDYKIDDMNTMISNMRRNIDKATLRQLKEDGIISELDDSTLNSDITFDIAGFPVSGIPAGKSKIGDLTVTELIAYVNGLLDVINNLPF